MINPNTKYEADTTLGSPVILVRRYTDELGGGEEREWMTVVEAMAALQDMEVNGAQFQSAHIEAVNVDMGLWDRSM